MKSVPATVKNSKNLSIFRIFKLFHVEQLAVPRFCPAKMHFSDPKATSPKPKTLLPPSKFTVNTVRTV